jgi:hypothetical protein
MRFSLKTLLFVLTLLILSLAAILYPNRIIGACFTTVAIAVIMFGASAAKIHGGAARAYWVGFTVFGGGYLFFATFSGGTIGSMLVTTELLTELHRWRRQAGWATYEGAGYQVTLHVGHSILTILFAVIGGAIANWLYQRGGSNRSGDTSRR